MPLPDDPKLIELSQKIIDVLHELFGVHPGFRPAHAKGLILDGTFVPTPEASTLSDAPHFTSPSTPVEVRFSSSTGIPLIPDTDPNANPRGLGVRFVLGDHKHTDVVAHSANGFPAKNGDEFLGLFTAIRDTPPGAQSPTAIEQFLGSHPAALKFIQLPKPFPATLGNEAYYSVSAFKFTNAEGKVSYVRYRILPVAGEKHLTDDEVKSKSPNYLYDELPHVEKSPIKFKIFVQVANEGDPTDDATIQWPDDRKIVELGEFTLTNVHQDNAAEQRHIIYDPIPRVHGVEATADPLLELRAAVYLLSGRERRKVHES